MNDIMLTCITTLISIVAGAIISILLVQRKKLLWIMRKEVLIEEWVSEIDNLEIRYDGYEVHNLALIHIAFWNNGKVPITANDIVQNICISVPNHFNIFHADVIAQSNITNEFNATVSENKQNIELSFMYLDYKQGAVIEILSDCAYKSQYKMQGTVIGCKDFTSPLTNKLLFNGPFYPLYGASLFSLICTYTLLIKYFPEGVVVYLLLMAIQIICVVFCAWLLKLVADERKIPKELRKFY